MYFVNNETGLIKHIDNNVIYIFTIESREGLHDQYLAWLAEGNTPEEWQPES